MNSPGIDTLKPISRRDEAELCDYYAYQFYWERPTSAGAPMGVTAATATSRAGTGACHLRSDKEVVGYRIEAIDGELGKVSDFIVDDTTWAIRYLVVETSGWWAGEKVLLAPEWVARIGWEEAKVFVDLSRDLIKQSPKYDESALLSREYEDKLFDHYGYPRYWER
jgi:hypothetical protein